ncbi:DUF1080 domain-containing protein [bacterium]|nr:DUF1080 domain-containing protein [bacterium]
MNRSTLLFTLCIATFQFSATAQEWIPLFDGKTLDGWRPSENKGTWRVEDGTLVSRGGRSHLFYDGDVQHHDFKNFEFRAEVKTTTASNSGIYLHTHYQETDFPETGYECQVINGYPTNPKPNQYVERKMTSSIYAIHNVWKSPARDNEWFRYRIVVQGKTIRTYINDELMAEYTESEHPFRPADKKGRLLSSGTFALQGHDAGSVVFYRNIEVKPLPDNLPTPGTPTDDPAFDAKIIQLSDDNFPLLDLDVQLGHGLTLDGAMANARRFGYTYGFVFSGPLPASFRKPLNAFVGFKATEPQALNLLAGLAPGTFDYVIASTGYATGNEGRVSDPQASMEKLVAFIEDLAARNQVNIYGEATALPDNLMADYDALWTPVRMDRVINALKAGNVAMEINDRLKVPSAAFIKRAKAAGIHFTFGSGNTGANDLGRLRYCIDMVEECRLNANDLWLPQ